MNNNPNQPFDKFAHYYKHLAPTGEFKGQASVKHAIKNIGWTLGNDCPYTCKHCYSMNARQKGANMTKAIIDRVVSQLASLSIETVNLGGNEPIFTNGNKISATLLPYIIQQLVNADMLVGLTTSGISINALYRYYRETFYQLNDVDVSLDSPFPEEHDRNRGGKTYAAALRAARHCVRNGIPCTLVYCAMSWNFSSRHIDALINLAKELGTNIRINPLKPTLPEHMDLMPSARQFYEGFTKLMDQCETIEMGESVLSAASAYGQSKRCPCGSTSFRIHSITPDGKIFISPCVYLHEFKSEHNLLERELIDIVNSPSFEAMRARNSNPQQVEGCDECRLTEECGGGCTARSYLTHLFISGERSLLKKDPYCPKEYPWLKPIRVRKHQNTQQRLVHQDYLCTWIGHPDF